MRSSLDLIYQENNSACLKKEPCVFHFQYMALLQKKKIRGVCVLFYDLVPAWSDRGICTTEEPLRKSATPVRASAKPPAPIGMSHVTHSNESRYTKEEPVCKSATPVLASAKPPAHVGGGYMSHVTNSNESRHTLK